MATWEDGPEYAPPEPPAEFTVPDGPPLSVAEPRPPQPQVPGDRPRFGAPEEPVAPLGSLVPPGGAPERDPLSPFQVDSAAVTQSNSGGAWGAAHWRPPVVTGPAPSGPWGPPSGSPASAPTDPMAIRSAAPQSPGGLPAPGTPAWFGPGPAARVAPPPPPTLYKATPPGVIVLLALSLIWPIAPVVFSLAFILSARARYARARILAAFSIVGGVVLLIPTIVSFANYGDLTGWYGVLSVWALLGSLLMIVLVLVLVNTEINNRSGRPPGPRDYTEHRIGSASEDYWQTPYEDLPQQPSARQQPPTRQQ